MFHKYPSVRNEKQVGKTPQFFTHADEKWVRQEKIHGANFSIIPYRDESNEGISVKFASRNGLAEDTFYDFTNIKTSLEESGIRLLKQFPNASQLNIYGELYGGKIQPEISYQSEHMLKIFDVLVTCDNDTSWLPYDSHDIVHAAGFELVTVLETGPVIELINRPTTFVSEYSAQDAPECAEGYVVKYIDTTGQLLAAKHRAPQFMEDKRGKIVEQKEIQLKRHVVQEMDQTIEDYLLNTNRLSNVLSKMGPADVKNKAIVTRCLIDDAAQDYADDTEKTLGEVKKIMFPHFDTVTRFVEQELTKRVATSGTTSLEDLTV